MRKAMTRNAKSNVNEALTVIGAAGLGMLAMYLFDPDVGKRRRTLATDKLRSARSQVGHMADTASRDTLNRSRGVLARLRSRMNREEQLSGQRITERVRSRIGRVVSNPRALDVRADDAGRVVLEGPALASEVSRLMATVWSVRGVTSVEDQLQVYEHPTGVSALQNAESGQQPRGMLESWPPSVRLLAGSAGIAAAALSVTRGRLLGLLGAIMGGALLARSVGNQSLREMAGLSGTHSVHIDKDMYVAAPPERVYEFWAHQENFPRFMRNVEEVNPAGQDRWHWKVAGPFRSVEWDSEVVEREENRRLVWRTEPGAAVESEGRVEFQPEGEGTRLRVSMSYTPTAGAMGHLFARLLGKDAKSEMDEDLMRVKSFLETGKPAHDAAAARQAAAEEATRLH